MGPTVSCCRLYFSFLIIIIVFWSTYSPTTYPSCPMGLKLKIHIHQSTNPPRHLRARSGFRRFFSSLFWREHKKRGLVPTCIRSCNSLPFHFCTWTTIPSLLLFSRSLFLPLISIHGQSFARCLLFSCFAPRFHAVPCLVFILIHFHPNTNRQCLYPSYGIGLSLFSLLFFSSTFYFSSTYH